MYSSVSRSFKTFEPSFSDSSSWDPSSPIPNLVPRVDTGLSSRSYRKFAKPVSRSDTFSRPSQPASSYIDSYYNNDAASKRRKRGPSELNDNLADDNYIPSIKSAINGGTMPSAGLKAGLKRELAEDEDSDDDGLMKDSYFSDIQYRRNCGTANHESDDRGGKRRLLNVVGSVVGSIWEFCTSQMQNSLAGIIPKIGWSTAAAEYYDTPFNAPPGLFDEDNNVSPTTADWAKLAIPGAYSAPTTKIATATSTTTTTATTFKKPTLKSLIPPSPIKDDNEPFSARSPDFLYLDDDMLRSKMGGMDSPMSASWILVKPESNSRASSPVPKSPTRGASAASMRRSGSNSGSQSSTPIFSTPPTVSGLGRRTSYSRPVPSRKMRGVARPAGYTSGTRSAYLSRSSTASSSSSTSAYNLSSSQSAYSPSSSNFSQPSFPSFGRNSVASSATSVGSSLPTSPIRAGQASAAGQRVRGATVSGASLSKKVPDEDEDMAQMDFFSKQLRALIREGKEALGSKVEVLECDEEQDWM
ncbi:hypothetical protein ABW20_dc0104485 [Dactylellina cionopaga]|nr:hypothetical protein ABW20_dc0104485 [Dactylellina cionopaga]